MFVAGSVLVFEGLVVANPPVAHGMDLKSLVLTGVG